MNPKIYLLRIFPAGPGGGNPAPIVADAREMSDREMQDVARRYGHESAFVVPAPPDSGCDFGLRFWVPNHEMEMCGHATVGAVWLLGQRGELQSDSVSIWTRSGQVDAQVHQDGAPGLRVEVSQPLGAVEALPDTTRSEAQILSVLGITAQELASLPIQNARTSRTKTIIPLKNTQILNALKPDFARVEQLCAAIGSTGLYPYAPADTAGGVYEARQFPKASGYPEDAATGIAAAALAFGLLVNGLLRGSEQHLRIRQGSAMGRPSEIAVRFRVDDQGRLQGCWLGGQVEYAEPTNHSAEQMAIS